MTPPDSRYEPRHLDWPDCLNARDLGGMPTRDGRQLRAGALIRSDRLSRLTPAGVAAVQAAGITRIVDLRTEEEAAAEPYPLADHASYLNVAWPDTVPWLVDATSAELYVARLDEHGDRIGAAVVELAEAPPGGVVVHCAIGKDRTGLVVALLLDLLGVEADQIADDYALSHPRMAASFDDELAVISDPVARARVARLQRSDPESIRTALDHLYEKYDGATSYLRTNGVTADQLAALTARFL